MLGGAALRAQESTVDLPGVIVRSTFELRRSPTSADSFMKYLDKQIDAKRAADEAGARTPFWNARFGRYIPIGLGCSSIDPTQFCTPSYLAQDYRNDARVLEESRKDSLCAT